MVKTLVIGLDAATWGVIDPLLEEGALPNLESLIEDGASGVMESTFPPMTPLAWTSISTGTNPGKHGVYDFLEQDRESYEITNTDYSKMSRPTVWDLFNLEGREIGVINYPLVHPPAKTDAFFISGIPAGDEDRIAYPPEVQEYLDSTDYRIYPRGSSENPRQYFDELRQTTDNQLEVTLELLGKYDPELLWTVFMGIDWAQHYLWGREVEGRDAVEAFYAHIDGVIGRLLGEIEDGCNVVVLSDHGATRIDGEIHLNSLLEEWGYLERDETDDGTVVEKLERSLLASMWRVGTKLPHFLKNKLKRKASSSFLNEMRVAADIAQLNMHRSINWEETTAFSYGYMGRIFIHTDEYPQGKIETNDEYESLRDEIIRELEELEHPETGEKIVEKAVKSEKVYSGENTGAAPDIIFESRGWKYMVYCDFGDEGWISEPRDRIADHDSEGIIIVSGDGVQDMDTKVTCDVTDVAPTLLYLHDLSVLEGMDGGVLTQLLTDEFLERHEIKKKEDFKLEKNRGGEGKHGDVEERLEDLGYL